jgi:hypothetical protein
MVIGHRGAGQETVVVVAMVKGGRSRPHRPAQLRWWRIQVISWSVGVRSSLVHGMLVSIPAGGGGRWDEVLYSGSSLGMVQKAALDA